MEIQDCFKEFKDQKGVYVPCDNGFKLSPNPASNTLTVSVNENNESVAYLGFDEVRIYDLQNNLKMYQRFNKVSSAIINIGGLISGAYFVEISSGTYKERQQLIIQK